MSAYLFENLALSENSVHFLRNRYCYQKYYFEDIELITLKRGKSINNWPLLLLLGVILSMVGLGLCLVFVLLLVSGKLFDSGRLLIPATTLSGLFLGWLGTLIIRQSLKTTFILVVQVPGFRKNGWLPHRVRHEQVRALMKLLETKCPGRFKAEVFL
jgi:hypothetical protein